MKYQIIKKTNKEGMIYFALNDAETGKEITSSELLFDPKFFERFGDDIWQEDILSHASEGIDILAEVRIFDKKDFLGILGREFLKEIHEHKFMDISKIDGFQDHREKIYRIYEILFHLYQFLGPEGYYNASSKLHSLASDYSECDEHIYMKGLYYYDIERIDDMDNSLRKLMMSIKNFQKREDIQQMLEMAFGNQEEKIYKFAQRKKIDTICIVPNNVSRKISFNAVIEEVMQDTFEELPFLKVQVHDFEGRKPQKATRGLCERIKNADQLFTVDPLENGGIPKRILLIDDVFGSGATMNMIAKKIKQIYPDVEIFGFAILGSYRKGFDVINEI